MCQQFTCSFQIFLCGLNSSDLHFISYFLIFYIKDLWNSHFNIIFFCVNDLHARFANPKNLEELFVSYIPFVLIPLRTLETIKFIFRIFNYLFKAFRFDNLNNIFHTWFVYLFASYRNNIFSFGSTMFFGNRPSKFPIRCGNIWRLVAWHYICSNKQNAGLELVFAVMKMSTDTFI